ncbi:hypothetical protein N0V86_005051 [Didymella sp. IMI 355093]|nr:hypothetical protein N0V86_005051 [Didymella sp. IMI 355093]
MTRAKPAIAPVAQEAPTQSAKPTAPTQSIAPTESTAPTEPIATQASIELITSATPTQEHPLTMDHILATLKANLEAQIHTARSASRRETSHLRAQNQALELRAVRLETEREKYKADAAAAEARAKAAEAKVRAAEDDSAERKERCEERCDELRKVLEGAITRLGWMECSGSGGATGKAQENGEVGCSEFVFGKAS